MHSSLPENFRRSLILLKYLLISLSVYCFIITAIYILVDICKLEKILAYVIVYITAYFIEYITTLRLVFNEQHHWIKVIKYIIYVGLFLGLSTYIFKLLISFDFNYLLATLLVSMVFMPFRFIVNKYWVYC